jgi:polysaccharide biosynthesis/export protein ExoF
MKRMHDVMKVKSLAFLGKVLGVVRFTVLGSVAALALTDPARGEDGFRLGAGDRLRIAVPERSDYSGEYAIGPGGSISIPLVGQVLLEGRSLPEAEAALATALKERGGMAKPQAVIDVVQYRPFFVLGGVENSGMYPYAPGLTVMQALAMAGGYRKPLPQDGTLRLETARLREKLLTTQDAYAIAAMRLAGLAAEQKGRQTIEPPQVGIDVNKQRGAELLANEEAMLKRRSVFQASEIEFLTNQKKVLGDETAALQAQLLAKQSQIGLIQQEIEALKRISAEGLVPLTRNLEIRRQAAQAEGDRQQIIAYISRAQNEMSNVDIRILAVTEGRKVAVAEGIKQAEDELAQLRIAIDAANEQLERAELLAGTRLPDVALPGDAETAAMPFSIARRNGSGPQTLPAKADTLLQPGDVLHVRLLARSDQP